ncbi:MAG: YihY/virulence factor BrkB family protein [Rhodothalassiaceae bacterium]
MTDSSNVNRPRGAPARWPWQIPRKGWRAILARIWRRNLDNSFGLIAAGVAFYAMLSTFPAITAFVSLYGYFADPAAVSNHVARLQDVMPPDSWKLIEDQIRSVGDAAQGKLGLGALLSLLITFWFSGAGLRAVVDALNHVYREQEDRGLIGSNLVVFAMTIAGLLVGLLALAVIIALPVVLRYLQLAGTLRWVLALAPWGLLVLVIMFSISALYRFGPSRRAPKVSWISMGAVCATILWLLISVGFSYYVATFGAYNRVYGTVGAVAALLIWFWLNSYVVILGGALNAEMEFQTRRDTTVGDPKPMGERGAFVADHLPGGG